MRGSIVRRGGTWSIVHDEPTGDGTRRQRWVGGYKTRREAERALADALARIGSGGYVEPSRLSFGAYLTGTWLPSIRASVRPSTLTRYKLDVNTKLVPALGAVPLQRVTGAMLDKLYADLLGRGLSPASARHLHAVAHRALRDATRNDLIPRNVADAATPPRVARRELAVWTAAELRTFLASVEEDRLYAAWWLLSTAGPRRGEALGLRWSDVDLKARRLAIVRSLVQRGRELEFTEPKTKRGRRSLVLDERTAAILEAHRRRQLEERFELGLGRPEPDGLVFTDPLGEPVKPDSLSQKFDRTVARLGLPRIRLHDLRHGAATLMLASGANPKTVSERLGHASTAFTMDTYAASVPALEEETAAKVAALLDADGPRR
jgi:integrase